MTRNAPEIEAVRRAIDRTGRPMVLSLSPGETPLDPRRPCRARTRKMWRITDDFWDEWRCWTRSSRGSENWSPHRRAGAWPDADMLPLGLLALGPARHRFTPDEQRTLMTLWAIARSPLIMGGDLRQLDEATLALLTNAEVLAVNQHSRGNRQLDRADPQSPGPPRGEVRGASISPCSISARAAGRGRRRLDAAGVRRAAVGHRPLGRARALGRHQGSSRARSPRTARACIARRRPERAPSLRNWETSGRTSWSRRRKPPGCSVAPPLGSARSPWPSRSPSRRRRLRRTTR